MYTKIALNALSGLLSITLFTATWLVSAQEQTEESKPQICGSDTVFIVRKLDSQQRDNFCETYKDKVLLVVNTASRCGNTYQYEDLEKLYSEYQDQGFVVVGFPSNDFGNQEPGQEKSIKKFCRLTYGVRFPMYAKTRVRGKAADPLYQTLANAAGQSPRWNFHKYLIDRNGGLAGSYNSSVEPRSTTLINAIEQLL